jgi:tetratricopeptide (TPR) repeat protein
MVPFAVGRRGWYALVPLLLLCFAPLWGGCSPETFVSPDEDRDFQRARDAERLRDYQGAAEYYERALERNPRAAVIHLAYAALCEGQLRRYAQAVYHYQRYLRLRPDDLRADDIRRRVTNCTERLATSVPLVVRSEIIARDLEAVRRENQNLLARISNLASVANHWSNEVRRLNMASQDAGESGSQSRSRRASDGPLAAKREGDGDSADRFPRSTLGGFNAAGSARTHRVERGETLIRIARQHGVSVEALRQANPRVHERRLLPGTVLRIPGGI